MDSGVLLDLLGNENRRRILRLLSRKPCYVTEISEYLGVSPKAVIDHLQKLEDAGMIESRTDDRRRKYFHIARNVRLEVSVSPYDFGAKSAYAASSSLDMNGRCPHLTIELPEGGGEDVSDLAAEFARLRDLEHELSVAQRWLHGRMTETLEELNDRIGVEADSRFFADLLAAVASTDGATQAIAEEVSEPREAVERGLQRLADAGLLVRTGNGWRFARG